MREEIERNREGEGEGVEEGKEGEVWRSVRGRRRGAGGREEESTLGSGLSVVKWAQHLLKIFAKSGSIPTRAQKKKTQSGFLRTKKKKSDFFSKY
jgi:hypothetical protein